MRDRNYNQKIKKFQSSVWQVRDRYYDRNIKSSSRLSGGCEIIVVCLASARSLLRPEKKKIQSSVWRVRDRYYDRKIKKFQSSVWQVRDHYYDLKEKKI